VCVCLQNKCECKSPVVKVALHIAFSYPKFEAIVESTDNIIIIIIIIIIIFTSELNIRQLISSWVMQSIYVLLKEGTF
jgi:hypothetical protein